MKKVLVLAGLALCLSGVYAAETSTPSAEEGKKRNEEAFERTLEQTGWKNEKAAKMEKSSQQNSNEQNHSSSPSKSS